MATSAVALKSILETVSKEFGIDYNIIFDSLKDKDLLPKKLINVPTDKPKKNISIYASKAAEELAIKSGFIPDETMNGSSKNNKFTIADIKKLMNTPKKNTLLISPTALNYANEKLVNIDDIIGSGVNGRIILKDVEAFLNKEQPEEEEEQPEEEKEQQEEEEEEEQEEQPEEEKEQQEEEEEEEQEEQEEQEQEQEEQEEEEQELFGEVQEETVKKCEISKRALLELQKLNIPENQYYKIKGTGKDGIIMKNDVTKYIQSSK